MKTNGRLENKSTGKPPYACEECGAEFMTKMALNGHKGGEQKNNQHRSLPRYEINNYGHAVWKARNLASRGPDDHTVVVHRLLMVAEGGFDALRDKVVHHKNEIPWDNRVENLELMGKEEHARLHSEERFSDEELLDELVAGALALGRPPRRTDMANWGEFSPQTYRQRWGSWEAAIRAAGLEKSEVSQ